MIKLLLLATLFEVKHLIGDFFLQKHGQSSRKRLPGWRGLKALFIHSFYHGGLTWFIIGWYLLLQWRGAYVSDRMFFEPIIIGLIDFGTHFAIDFANIKASKRFAKASYLPDGAPGSSWGQIPIPTELEVVFNKKLALTLLVLDQLFHHGVYCYFIWRIYTGVA